MKRSSTIFLQAAIVLVGVAVLIFMLWEPHIEGRNAHATLFEIYFEDPSLACAYGVSIAFFVALYQAFKLLGCVGRHEVFSPPILSALQTIKYCAVIIVGFVAVGEAYLFTVIRGTDDIAGGVAMGLFVAFLSTAVATAAAVFERKLQTRIN